MRLPILGTFVGSPPPEINAKGSYTVDTELVTIEALAFTNACLYLERICSVNFKVNERQSRTERKNDCTLLAWKDVTVCARAGSVL